MIREKSTAKIGVLAVVVLVAVVAFVSVPIGCAEARLLIESSLSDGDYGVGTAIDTMDSDHGGSPHVLGLVDGYDGVTFTSTESSGQSNALINWYIANVSHRSQFCTHGTVSFMFKADRETHVSGEIFGDNYGFDAFRHGQSSISARANRIENEPGIEDDQVGISWATTDSSEPWFWHGPITLEYDRWYHIGFAWGGPEDTHETWICAELVAADSEGPIPWGVSWGTGSATNIGLGDNHERGVSGYGSAAGVTFADIRIWDEYRAQGDTIECPWIEEEVPTPTPVESLAPNLTLAKSASPSTIEEGETTTIAIQIENEGTGDAKAVKLTDTLPRGFTITNGSRSATFGEIQSGDYRTLEYTLKATGSGKFTCAPATATYTDAEGNSYAATSNSVNIQVASSEAVSVSVDSDGDGWSDAKEKEMGTNPYSIDSDNDGLNDPEDPNPTVPNNKKIPGFEGIFALAGLLMAVFFVLRLRKRS